MSVFDTIKAKARGLVDGHGDKVDQGIDQAGAFADDKTGGQHAEHVDQASEKARSGLDALDGQDDDLR